MNTEISNLRKKIDKVNQEILKLINQRQNLAVKVGEIKKQNNLQVVDIKREDQVYDNIKKQAKQLNLDENFVVELFRLIIKNSKDIQWNQKQKN